MKYVYEQESICQIPKYQFASVIYLGLANTKAGFGLAAVGRAAAVFNANSTAAKFCSGLFGIKDSRKS